MLTGELLRVRREGDQVVPRYLSAAARRRLEPTAAELCAAVERVRGKRRADLQAAFDDVDCRPADRLIVAGLRKLLTDRCEFGVAEGPDPALLRAQVFELAACRRRELGPREELDRDEVLAAAASAAGLEPAALSERLFADLRDNERLLTVRPIDPSALLDRYDLGLAQAVLLRASRVRVTLEQEDPASLRALFRAARFQGLLHRVERQGPGGYCIALDGPLSLFSQSKRYGLKLALFLPAVLRCRRWRLEAELLWGRPPQPAWFRLGPEQGLRTAGRLPAEPDGAAAGEPGGSGRLAPEVEELRARFAALGSPWSVAPNDEILALPGEVACVPDLVFQHGETGERVYLEVFGFWSRQAVWQRVETVRRGFPARIILAVGRHLRVSDDVLEEHEAGELYVYRTTLSARAILDRLERG